jgi:hypothetical protein
MPVNSSRLVESIFDGDVQLISTGCPQFWPGKRPIEDEHVIAVHPVRRQSRMIHNKAVVPGFSGDGL